jgi:hypothetical protein
MFEGKKLALLLGRICPLVLVAATSDRVLEERVDCMVSVLKTIPEAVEVRATSIYDEKQGYSRIVNYTYRGKDGRLHKASFALILDEQDGSYRTDDSGLLLYDVMPVLDARCHVRPFAVIR